MIEEMNVSVIIRTRNEANTLARCVRAVLLQRDVTPEIVLVDNASMDGTPEMGEKLGCRVISIPESEFSYGRAINRGIQAAGSEYLAILSAHCIPVNDLWLMRLIANLLDPNVAGVYGRQEPLPDSSDFDKRDLWTTFGLDRKVQRKDYFFHNANSAIRRDVWEDYPFNETIAGVEDRAWAKQVLAAGYTLVYEPEASVYHPHGIHQGRDERRARRVVHVIEMIQNDQM
jgi:glycosyltransferase involved in cell wall biosynthesis